jgi:hypothetical protein
LGEAVQGPADAFHEIEERPARDDRVVAQKNEAAQHTPQTYEAPYGSERLLEGPDRAFLGLPTDQQLGHHDREPNRGDADEINENERTAVVFPRDEREFPQVAEADGTTSGGEHEA